MDIGPSSESRSTTRNRVLSPSAAKMGAELIGSCVAIELRRVDKILSEQFHNHAPTLPVRHERGGPASSGI